MTNHYHLLIETPDGNLSKGMRHLNGVYTQRFNRRHNRVGHVFQGRFKGILVDREAYLLELSRYIVLNPVRAKMVRSVRDWRWSSYRATTYQAPKPVWLNVDWLLSNFDKNAEKSVESYKQFVASGRGVDSPFENLVNQVYLGDDEFVDKVLAFKNKNIDLSEVPSAQKRSPHQSIPYYEGHSESRDGAIVDAYASGGYSMKEIGEYFGLHYSRVSRIINKAKIKT